MNQINLGDAVALIGYDVQMHVFCITGDTCTCKWLDANHRPCQADFHRDALQLTPKYQNTQDLIDEVQMRDDFGGLIILPVSDDSFGKPRLRISTTLDRHHDIIVPMLSQSLDVAKTQYTDRRK